MDAYGLPLVAEVDSARDFGDEQRGHLELAVLLVDAEEVDLAHLDLLLLHQHGHGHAGDRGDQLLVLVADADQPVDAVAGRGQRPSQELSGVVEAVGAIVVLHVVVGEEVVELRGGRGTSSSMPSLVMSISSQ